MSNNHYTKTAAIDSRKASETKGAWVSAVNDAARTGSATAANTAVREYMKWSESLGRPKTREQAESFIFGRIGEKFSGRRRSPFRAG